MLQAFRNPQHLRNLFQERRVNRFSARNIDGNFDIRARAERRQQIEFLEDEADFALAQSRPLAVRKARKIHAVDGHASRIRPRQSSEKIKESRLPAPRRPHDRDKLAFLYVE